MKFYKDDGKKFISSEKSQLIELDSFLIELEKLPSSYQGNFIGLINNKAEAIQFIRFGENEWMIDIPVLDEGIFVYSLQDDSLTTEKVKEITKKYFLEADWKYLCNLKRAP